MDPNLPVSKTFREFYDRNGYELTDYERAAFYYHSRFDCSLKFVNHELRKIANSTENKKLRKDIMRFFRAQERAWNMFCDNRDGQFVYLIDKFEGVSHKMTYVNTFANAECSVDFIIRSIKQEDWNVYRHILPTQVTVHKKKMMTGKSDAWGEYGIGDVDITFDTKGHIIRMGEIYADKHREYDPTRFSDTWIHIYSPFQKGDVVRDGDVYCVVPFTPEQFESRFHRKYLMEPEWVDLSTEVYAVYCEFYTLLWETHVFNLELVTDLNEITDPGTRRSVEFTREIIMTVDEPHKRYEIFNNVLYDNNVDQYQFFDP